MKSITKNTIALLSSAIGLTFCVLSALGLTEGVCVSEGCRLFQDVTLLGINFYWFGAVFFAVTIGLLLSQRSRRDLQRRPQAPLALTLWLSAGLTVSALLLAIQALTLPCLSCLLVAGLLGITALLSLSSSRLLTGILLIWSLLLLLALSGLLRQQLTPVPVFGAPEKAIRFFFSPSCPACLVGLQTLAAREDLHQQLALYPLATTENDLAAIFRLRQSLKYSSSLNAAIAALDPSAQNQPNLAKAPSFRELQELRLLSFRNKAFLAGIGAQSIPYLLTSAPLPLISAPPAQISDHTPAAESEQNPPLLPDLSCALNPRQEKCPPALDPRHPLLNFERPRPLP